MRSYAKSNHDAKDAGDTLVHYLRNAGCDVSGDHAIEIRSIIDSIISATIKETKKLIAEQYEESMREDERIFDREFGL